MYKTIIFDLGGVIEKIAPKSVAIAFEKLGMVNAENFFSLFKQSDICSAFELGNITEDHFIDSLASMCNPSTTKDLIKSAWCANQLGISKETIATLDTLRKQNFKLFLLSNTNSIHANMISDVFIKTHRNNLSAFFDGIYYSFKMHLRKPSEAAYRYLLEHEHLLPEECIYIDDLKDNLDAPNRLGLQCIHHAINDEISSINLIASLLKN